MDPWLRKAAFLVVGASLATGSGCFSVSAQAPYGAKVKLLPPDVPVEVSRKNQKWFILFGIIPLTPADSPRDIIEREHLTEVRVIVEDTFRDVLAGAIITILTIGIISPTTVTVEGNRAPLVSGERP